MNAGLLLLHGFFGAALAAHGLQKLLTFGVSGTTAYVESLGFRAPRMLALAVIGNELVGGALLAVGLLMPLAVLVVASTMLVAARTDHRGKGWFITGAGAEYVVTNAIVAVVLAALGGGRYSLDAALGIDVTGIWWAAGVAGGALLASGFVVAAFQRRREPVTLAPNA